MQTRERIKKLHLEHAFLEGTFGIEKEGLRINQDGELMLTDHPSTFGSRSHHPYIQTDFSESQIELITPTAHSLKEVFGWLHAVHDTALRTLPEDEFVWPYSMPAILPLDDSLIPLVKVKDQKEVEYREMLAEKYGRKKQMISGIHYNFMFSPNFLTRFVAEETDKEKATERFLLKLAQNFYRYRWILTYLFGASPVALSCFFDEAGNLSKDASGYPLEPMRSLRNSPDGYPSNTEESVSHRSFEAYANDIEKLVATGVLEEEREYYGDVRLRTNGSARQLTTEGLSYFEFRAFDVDPFCGLGISKETASFVHYFLLYMVWLEELSTDADVKIGIERNAQTATEHPLAPSAYKEEGIEVVSGMLEMIKELGVGKEAEDLVTIMRERFDSPEQTPAARLLKEINEKGSLLKVGTAYARQYKEDAAKLPYRLRGFEDMEMSTQLLMYDAIQVGIEIDIMDRLDQFLELKYRSHVEYVKNANMTSKDSYISALLMGNKTAAKVVMKKHGFIVPEGDEFHSVEEAVAAFWKIEKEQIVVKPKSTNYGVGISVFKEPPLEKEYKKAIELAFLEDEAVLVEKFAHGTEYRFFVLDGRTEAVVLRVPANVKGDGTRSIAALIDEKNTHPYRGEDHRAPLEKIKLGELERLMLHQQGFKEDDVPAAGEIVYLRENSNISTGGDSIDFTDEMDDSYKKIAAGIADAMGAKVCGVDLIIQDYTQTSTREHPGYIALEANYNPAMHMHAFVYKGTGRRLTPKILKMLFPEIE